jgi:predicted TPR repeat methyltransferase
MTIDLDAAYTIHTPEDSKRLYAAWAETYESGFVADMDYRLPLAVAESAAKWQMEGPILDLGAGTGLVGAALASLGCGPIDGTDIAVEMLAKAAEKACYRALFHGDIVAGLPVPDHSYAGIVSSGTFTLGHVGPEALPEVVRILRPGGLALISVSKNHWRSSSFCSHLEHLRGITARAIEEVPIYGAFACGDHAQDRAYLLRFRKLPI